MTYRYSKLPASSSRIFLCNTTSFANITTIRYSPNIGIRDWDGFESDFPFFVRRIVRHILEDLPMWSFWEWIAYLTTHQHLTLRIDCPNANRSNCYLFQNDTFRCIFDCLPVCATFIFRWKSTSSISGSCTLIENNCTLCHIFFSNNFDINWNHKPFRPIAHTPVALLKLIDTSGWLLAMICSHDVPAGFDFVTPRRYNASPLLAIAHALNDSVFSSYNKLTSMIFVFPISCHGPLVVRRHFRNLFFGFRKENIN